jgi:hypothetical protein
MDSGELVVRFECFVATKSMKYGPAVENPAVAQVKRAGYRLDAAEGCRQDELA